MKNGNEKIIEKIEKNTEYSIRMPDGKIQKFAYYGEKDNGRLILLNTRYGTLTTMGAAYFLKLISGKYPCSKRPFKVERPEEQGATENTVSAPKNDSKDRIDELLAKERRKREEEEKRYDQFLNKMAIRLKTLPIDVEYKLEKELKVAPAMLSKNILEFLNDGFKGSIPNLLNNVTTAEGLLKGTEWEVR